MLAMPRTVVVFLGLFTDTGPLARVAKWKWSMIDSHKKKLASAAIQPGLIQGKLSLPIPPKGFETFHSSKSNLCWSSKAFLHSIPLNMSVTFFPQVTSRIKPGSPDFQQKTVKWDGIFSKFHDASSEASSEGKSRAAIDKHIARQLLGKARMRTDRPKSNAANRFCSA
jgi:hypothetical protein